MDKMPLLRHSVPKLDRSLMTKSPTKSVPELVTEMCAVLEEGKHVVVGDSYFGNLSVVLYNLPVMPIS